ncbi:MAG: hypothetical protein QME16_04085 [Planctomycetota bacterium]|nr:hypothetical protein [Planctomycetota bacterium]
MVWILRREGQVNAMRGSGQCGDWVSSMRILDFVNAMIWFRQCGDWVSSMR